jgi:type III restriction enzyme
MSQTLNDKLNGAVELGLLKADIPDDITGNLARRSPCAPIRSRRWNAGCST